MNWWSIPENLLSDIILGASIFVISWGVILFTKRIPLQRFFGVGKTKRLAIYISNIRVRSFGSINLSGNPVSYDRESVNYGEMKTANQFKSLFSFIVPRTEEAPKTIGKLLFSDVNIQIIKSPTEISDLDEQVPFIAIGSPVFNAGSAYIENTGRSIATFRYGVIKEAELHNGIGPASNSTVATSDTGTKVVGIIGPLPIQPLEGDTGISLPTGGAITFFFESNNPGTAVTPSGISMPTGSSISSQLVPFIPEPNPKKTERTNSSSQSEIIVEGIPSFNDTTYGFVQRIKDPNSDRMLFYAAGISELSSTGAANYLATQWKNLYKKYKSERSFFIMLKFDETDINKWSIKLERELPD